MKLITVAAPDFDLEKTLDSGQVFHWEEMGNGFCGTIGDTPIYVEQHGDTLRIPSGQAGLIRNYFALDHPLAKICASFPSDALMQAARDYCRGLRIIRQPRWECLATFICSSMKQVAHIRQISCALRRRFGEPRKIKLQPSIHNAQGGSSALSEPSALRSQRPRAMPVYSASPAFVNVEVRAGRAAETARSTYDHTLYTFPSAERIAMSSEEQLRKCALGYRAKNLLATARLVSSGEAKLEAWSTLSDVDLRTKLCALPGVGSKVANCVMLFGYERLRAFPIDVWIERVLRKEYFPGARKVSEGRLRIFSEEYFGQYGGYAQQYLFHRARTASAKRSNAFNRDDSKGKGGSRTAAEAASARRRPNRLANLSGSID